MTEPEFTDDQICDAIADALKEKNFKVVTGLMHLLAIQSPHKAETLLGYIQILAHANGAS